MFEDRRSGAKADRPGLAATLDYARSGDSVVVWRLDRLGRSLSDLIALVRRMEDAGVQLRSLTEGIDTSTTNGKLTFRNCSPTPFLMRSTGQFATEIDPPRPK